MPAKAFIDTNVIIYALGSNSTQASLAAPLFAHQPTISTQVLSETANVVLKKLAMLLSETGKLFAMLEATCRVEIVVPATLHRALGVSDRYGFS
jgi:predicted nucleic acid-binding protein